MDAKTIISVMAEIKDGEFYSLRKTKKKKKANNKMKILSAILVSTQ